MHYTIFFVLFAIMGVMLITWFALCKWVFTRLQKAHPGKYEEMEKPSLFLRNNLSNTWLFLSFLLKREYQFLGDERLARVCGFMRIFFAVYLVGFITMAVLIIALNAAE